MIDLHCHILPGIDDGPQEAEESMKMAELAVQDGIDVIVATPHSHNGVYLNEQKSIALHCAHLNELVQSWCLPLTILPGAEVRIHQGMERFIEEEKIASFSYTQHYLLVEFPHNIVLPGTREVIFQMTANDITPIIAHPERNEAIQRNPEILTDLANMGCLVQLTAMSITGELGYDAMVCAHNLLKEGKAHIIASDAHNADTRPPILSPAVHVAAKLLRDNSAAEAMVTKIPQTILEGKSITLPEPERTSKPSGWLQRFFR